jgi:hypothetical protein
MDEVTIRLEKLYYQKDLGDLREAISGKGAGQLVVKLYPPDAAKPVHLMLNRANAYLIGFRGKTAKGKDQWYFLKNSQPTGVAGKELGLGENYNQLPMVESATRKGLAALSRLGEFVDGDVLDGSLITLAAAVVSEAARFATVTTYFIGLINGTLSAVDVPRLCAKYFRNWDDMTQEGNPDVLLENRS